jgi:ribonuclease inhibitor
MAEYIINFGGVSDFQGFYRAIIDSLGFPTWCGSNADAIWDMLTGYMEYPDVIYFRGWNSLPKSLDIIKQPIKDAFERAADFYDDEKFRFEIVD